MRGTRGSVNWELREEGKWGTRWRDKEGQKEDFLRMGKMKACLYCDKEEPETSESQWRG